MRFAGFHNQSPQLWLKDDTTFMRVYIRWLFCCFGYIPSIKYWSELQPFTEHKITPGAN